MDALSADQIAILRQALLDLQQELKQTLESASDSCKPVDLDSPIGRLSRVDALQQQAMAKAKTAGLKRRLQQVEAALQAMRSGRYGECRMCEEPIDYARLKARPEAPLCFECQSEMEQKS